MYFQSLFPISSLHCSQAPIVVIVTFLRDFTIKSSAERRSFLKSVKSVGGALLSSSSTSPPFLSLLPNLLAAVPGSTVLKVVLPHMLEPIILSEEGAAEVVVRMLAVDADGSLATPNEFRRWVMRGECECRCI